MHAKPDATIEEVENTAEMANTKNFIEKKVVNMTSLSGGQR